MARRLSLTFTLVGLLLAFAVTPALGAIHPIVSGQCAAANGSDVANDENPVGQTPASFDPSTWDQSDLRALFATGVFYWDEDGNLAFDETVAALNGDSGTAKCPNKSH